MSLYDEGLQQQTNSQNSQNFDNSQFAIVPARVKFVFLDLEGISKLYPNLYKQFGSEYSLGGILYDSVTDPSPAPEDKETELLGYQFALPLFPNNRQVPLLNELIYIMSMPGPNLQNPNFIDTNAIQDYYFYPVNLWNSVHHNALPDPLSTTTTTPSEQKTPQQVEAGSRVKPTDGVNDISLGRTFIERANIKKALLWISKKTGFKSLEYAGVSVETWVKKIVYDIEDFLTSSVKKTVKFLEPGAKVGTKTAIKRGIVAGVATQGLKRLDRYLNVKIPKWKNTDRESELTPFIISENPEIYGKNIKFKDVDKEYGFEYYYLRDAKGNFYIYNVDTKKYEKLTPEDYEAAKNMFLMGGAYSKLKFNDFEVDKYDPKNPIYTINGVDDKMINDEFKLKKI